MKLLKDFAVVVLMAIGINSHAQTGNYFLSQYTPSDERIDYVTFDMAQDNNGVIYFANKSGVLEFDGRNWSLIATPGPVYTVTAQGSDVFIGGSSGYGKLVWGSENARTYLTLSKGQSGASQIISSLSLKDKLFFMNEQSVYVFSVASGKTESVIKVGPQQPSFTGLFEIAGNVYVETETNTLFRIDKDKLVTSDFALSGNQGLLFSTTLSGSNKVLLGTSNQLYTFDATTGLKQIHSKDSSFLENNVVVAGTWVNEKLVAIGTLRGGVVFINPNTGGTEEITNYYTGLPDNEVYSILCDRNLGVWVAHDYGFTRIAPYLPFRSYNHYPGLAGNLLCSYGFKGQLYVGTTLGLFALIREEVYADETFVTSQSQQAKTPKDAPPKTRKGLFSFFKKDKKATDGSNSGKKPNGQPQKLIRRVLKSIRYVFKSVEGVDGKVNQLIEANGKLLAAGISGVLQVDGLKATAILHQPVHFVFMSGSLKQLLISTFNDEVKSFSAEAKGNWVETHLLDTLHEYASYIFEDKFQNIWLCARNGAYKIETVDGAITETSIVPFPGISIDETVGVAYGNDVYVAASGVFNRYDEQQNKFVQLDSFPGPKKYFASAGYFWFYGKTSKDKHAQWRTVDPKMERALKLEWLGLFQNIRYLAPSGQDEGLWVITAANELYNFSSRKAAAELGGYPLFLREVRGQQSKIAPARSLKVSQLESTVTFDFIQPDFLGMKAIEYRYRVSGLSKDWSDWSTDNNIVNFSYLPTGDYKVEIQTLDMMGRVSEPTYVDLNVEPPYWKQSWFFAAEFIFFSFLVFFSIRLGASNIKYRFLSRLLSMLTVIMLIQFIQTVVSAQISFKSSPVTDFFIQVFIALLVLPIEGYLRKFMFRSANEPVETPRLWDEKK